MLRFLIVAVLCGWSSGFVAQPPMPDLRLIEGVHTTIAEHPHQAAVQLHGIHKCGASIISATWVVTSAACIQSYPSAYTVSVGSADIYGGKRYGVKNIAVHPHYDTVSFDYNIALLEIYGSFEFNAEVQPIQLATHEPTGNTIANVTGWGIYAESGGYSQRLLQISVPIVDRNVCEDYYANRVHKLKPREICAGLEASDKSPCRGDVGAPLSANGVLYGLFSWLYACGTPNFPYIYSNVANMRPWITYITGI